MFKFITERFKVRKLAASEVAGRFVSLFLYINLLFKSLHASGRTMCVDLWNLFLKKSEKFKLSVKVIQRIYERKKKLFMIFFFRQTNFLKSLKGPYLPLFRSISHFYSVG